MPFTEFSQLPQWSFRYGGRSSAELLVGWPRQISTQTSQSDARETITYVDPVTGLAVIQTARRITGDGALDWTLEFENRGPVDTPILEDIWPLDTFIQTPLQERLRLHTANGSSCQPDDFLPLMFELLPGQSKLIAPSGGRSSNGAFPFINLQTMGGGMVMAVGWSGQWSINAVRTTDGLRLSAGMQACRLFLHPGEKIRSPRILLLPWEGQDPEMGNNRLRHFLIDHVLPRRDGQLILPPVAQCLQSYFYLTGKAGESFEMAALPRVAALGAEAYWIDACWYGGQREWWQEVGTWVVNPARYPHGLKPISQAAHQAGMTFVLWFEPERVRPGSQLHQDHPGYLLTCPQDPTNLLFNLGDAAARKYLTNLISNLIAENGVDIYRQDFNFDPLPYWHAADEAGRVGMTEIRYVEGHYAFWDELCRRHPGLWIDNCASGGRRIDIETLSRALPLWPSDFSDTIGLRFGLGLHVGDQVINAGLARWVPLFGGGVWNFSPYGIRSQIIGGFTFGMAVEHQDFADEDTSEVVNPNDVLAKGLTLLDDNFPMEAAHAAIVEWKSVRPYLLGDFYLLLPLTAASHDWCAWQLHRGDLDAGVALIFRRHKSPFDSMELNLHGIDPAALYWVSLSYDFDEDPRLSMAGSDLLSYRVLISEKPGSVLLRYSKQSQA